MDFAGDVCPVYHWRESELLLLLRLLLLFVILLQFFFGTALPFCVVVHPLNLQPLLLRAYLFLVVMDDILVLPLLDFLSAEVVVGYFAGGGHFGEGAFE